MPGNAEGALKTAAIRRGLSVADYLAKREAGEKWCFKCKAWKPGAAFVTDNSRADGLSYKCRPCESTGLPRGWHTKPINPKTGRCGTAPKPSRDNDKLQARQRVNSEIRSGYLPRPNSMPCCDCGRVWDGITRHEYDHYRGYAAGHHLSVQAVCAPCHRARDCKKAAQAECIHGHPYTLENTGRKVNGSRFCRECRKLQGSKRIRPPGFWMEGNRRRKERKHAANNPKVSSQVNDGNFLDGFFSERVDDLHSN